ncbi:MAG: hypothetical protein IJI67_08990 [Clostridia bacterium]|nr:hypothetical protein [Clostridia bacterium]
MILCQKNYRNNKLYEKTLPEGTLNAQGLGALKRFRYGLFSFGWCGCEIIAVYNLLQLYGKPENLSEICREIYPYGHILCGFFGTNVYTLRHYFKKHYIPVKTVYNKSDFLHLAPKGRYGTISFWTGKVMASSIHTVTYKIEAGGAVTVFNRYNNKDCEYHYETMQEAFGNYPFIVANMM